MTNKNNTEKLWFKCRLFISLSTTYIHLQIPLNTLIYCSSITPKDVRSSCEKENKGENIAVTVREEYCAVSLHSAILQSAKMNRHTNVHEDKYAKINSREINFSYMTP